MPEKDDALPESEKPAAEVDATPSDGDDPVPDAAEAMPEGAEAVPEGDEALPESDAPVAEGDAPAPESDAVVPSGERRAPSTKILIGAASLVVAIVIVLVATLSGSDEDEKQTEDADAAVPITAGVPANPEAGDPGAVEPPPKDPEPEPETASGGVLRAGQTLPLTTPLTSPNGQVEVAGMSGRFVSLQRTPTGGYSIYPAFPVTSADAKGKSLVLRLGDDADGENGFHISYRDATGKTHIVWRSPESFPRGSELRVQDSGRLEFIGTDGNVKGFFWIHPDEYGYGWRTVGEAAREGKSVVPATVIAHFPLRDHGRDAANDGRSMSLTGTRFHAASTAPTIGAALFLPSTAHRAHRALGTVSRLRYGSYTVAVEFHPRELAPKMPIVMGGTAYRWFGLGIDRSGKLELTLNNGAFSKVLSDASLATGRWHRIAASVDVVRGRVIVALDGKLLEVVKLPADFVVNVLGTNREVSDRTFTFTNRGFGIGFHGFVRELRIFGRSMSAEELGAL